MRAAEIAWALSGHRAGKGWLCRCPVPSHGQGRGDLNPSLSIADGDRQQLLVTCFSGCEKTEVLRWLQGRGLLERSAANRSGMRVVRTSDSVEQERASERAIGLWRAALPVRGSLAEQYLATRRGLPGPYPASLRFLPRAWHRPTATFLPAMVAAVQAADERIIAAQLTYMNPATANKTEFYPARMTIGALGTGAIRLDQASEVLGLAEGVEDALAAMIATKCPCWASLGAQRLDKVMVPSSVRELHIFADSDEPGRLAARRAAGRHRHQGRRVVIHFAPPPLKDWGALAQKRKLRGAAA